VTAGKPSTKATSDWRRAGAGADYTRILGGEAAKFQLLGDGGRRDIEATLTRAPLSRSAECEGRKTDEGKFSVTFFATAGWINAARSSARWSGRPDACPLVAPTNSDDRSPATVMQLVVPVSPPGGFPPRHRASHAPGCSAATR
jgi:hypothetical protein